MLPSMTSDLVHVVHALLKRETVRDTSPIPVVATILAFNKLTSPTLSAMALSS